MHACMCYAYACLCVEGLCLHHRPTKDLSAENIHASRLKWLHHFYMSFSCLLNYLIGCAHLFLLAVCSIFFLFLLWWVWILRMILLHLLIYMCLLCHDHNKKIGKMQWNSARTHTKIHGRFNFWTHYKWSLEFLTH